MRSSSVEQSIVDTLSKGQTHQTSLQIFEEIRDRLPAVNPSTVYRALERMVSRGQVSVSDMGAGAAVYELVNEAAHHHLVCQKCGAITTLNPGDVDRFFTSVQRGTGFHIVTNHLVIFGVCKACQKA
jgi:Fur family transcriptional regulator, ferric uptake regulator